MPIDILMDQAYNTASHQPPKYQYYITQQQPQSQPQYTHEPQQQPPLVYENTRAYQDIYSTPSTAYVQDNSLYEQQQSQPQIQHDHQYHQQQQQQYYVPESLAEQYMTQLLHQAGIQNSANIIQQSIKVNTETNGFQNLVAIIRLM